jgi:hypothetical protein
MKVFVMSNRFDIFHKFFGVLVLIAKIVLVHIELHDGELSGYNTKSLRMDSSGRRN